MVHPHCKLDWLWNPQEAHLWTRAWSSFPRTLTEGRRLTLNMGSTVVWTGIPNYIATLPWILLRSFDLRSKAGLGLGKLCATNFFFFFESVCMCWVPALPALCFLASQDRESCPSATLLCLPHVGQHPPKLCTKIKPFYPQLLSARCIVTPVHRAVRGPLAHMIGHWAQSVWLQDPVARVPGPVTMGPNKAGFAVL